MSETSNRTILVPANLDLPTAKAEHATLQQSLAGGPAILEVEALHCTAPALQLLLATYQSLQAQGNLAGVGPHAAAILENVDF